MDTITRYNATRTFGIELEVIRISMNPASHAIQRAGLESEVESYNHFTRRHWKVTSDATVRDDGGRGGCEIISPVLFGSEGLAHTRLVCDVLAAGGAQVNKTCGYHVHHSVSDLNINGWRVLFKRYIQFEAALDELMFPDRRNAANSNEFCIGMRSVYTSYGSRDREMFSIEEAFRRIDGSNSVEELQRAICGECTCDAGRGDRRARCRCNIRYKKLNVGCYWLRGTIEFRHHGGTVSADKVIAWILLTQALIDGANETPSELLRPQELGLDRLLLYLSTVGRLDPAVVRHYRARAAQMAVLTTTTGIYRLASV